MRTAITTVVAAAALLVGAALGAGASAIGGTGLTVTPPPANAGFDYQIGGDYPLPAGVAVVSRDWFAGTAEPDPTYSICYVNGFQTQADEAGVDRPDELSNWPPRLVLKKLGDDPSWGGEYLIDLRSASKRAAAAAWVAQMVDGCAAKGYDAVEYDNLDSWTRFDGTPLARRVPFEKRDAVAYAKLLAELAHARGLAVGQKNTVELSAAQVSSVGFDFAIAEECGRYRECEDYRRLHDNLVVAVEYRRQDFAAACKSVGASISVVLRDRQVSTPGSDRYVYDAC